MATGDFVAAERLLKALRAAGCSLAVEGENVTVEGKLTNGLLAAINALKPELIALLVAEQHAPIEAATTTPPEIAPSPESTSLLDALPPRHTGTWVATAEWLGWKGRHDAALRDGVRFDEPPPNWVLRD